MPLSPKALEELERRGARSVRDLLTIAVGPGLQASVPLQIGELDPTRGDVESWLVKKDLEAENLAKLRHEQQLDVAADSAMWGRRAFWAAVVSVVATIILGVWGLMK